MVPNFKGPHAEDCGGCIINAEVEKLVHKLNMLSPVEKIIADLEHEKEEKRHLLVDRWHAFERAGVAEEGSVTDLVSSLINERTRLVRLLHTIENDIIIISNKIKDSK